MDKFLSILAPIYKLIPYVIAGVNTVHSEKDSETKVQIAQDALSIALAGAQQVLGENEQHIATAVGTAVSAGIAASQKAIDAIKGAQAGTV